MRIGMNPQKEEKKVYLKSKHRLIVVAFIPHMQGYYSDVFKVLQLCLASAETTINSSCKITVVNNGCCTEVVAYLNQCYLEGKIDTLVHHSQNIGKMDALIGAARASREEYITLSDIDILFKIGWQEAVEDLLDKVPEIGSVSPIAVHEPHTYATFSTMAQVLKRNFKLSFEAIVENHDDLNRFYESINWGKVTNKLVKWPVLKKGNLRAIMGSSHQILTVRRDIIMNYVPKRPSLTLVGNKSEYNYIDLPIDLSGKMRVCTYNNYAYHMGNKVEEWMIQVEEENKKNLNIVAVVPQDVIFAAPMTLDHRTTGYKIKRYFIKRLFKFFYSYRE